MKNNLKDLLDTTPVKIEIKDTTRVCLKIDLTRAAGECEINFETHECGIFDLNFHECGIVVLAHYCETVSKLDFDFKIRRRELSWSFYGRLHSDLLFFFLEVILFGCYVTYSRN